MESIPIEIRRIIMEHLSNTELLTVSLVSKQFNFEARSLVRDRLSSIRILQPRHLCQHLTSFVSDLKSMNFIPSSGIHYPLNSESHCKACRPLTPEELDSNFAVILEGFPWKHLSITFNGSGNIIKTCSATMLVSKVLQDFSGVLEQISLNDNIKLLQFILELIKDCRFPRLKILKLDGYTDDRDGTQRQFIKEMVARAPNLQEYQQQKPPNFLENLLQGSSAALVSDCQGFNPIYTEISQGINGIVKLKQTKLSYVLDNDLEEDEMLDLFSVERFNGIVRRVLQASSYTLNTLDTDVLFLIPLMSYGISFKNLTNFSIALDSARLEDMDPRILPLLKHFDFTPTVPNVHKVTIYFAWPKNRMPWDHVNEFIEQRTAAAMQEPLTDRAVNIKHLLCHESLTYTAVPFLAEWFPNIGKLWVKALPMLPVAPYPQIWKYWPALTEVQVEKLCFLPVRETWNINLDSDFCGIFPQEVAQLRQQDDEYLRTVNIVPVKPAVTCLRALRTIRLTILASCSEQFLNREPFPVFSKVTGLIAFQRRPDLSVTIETNCIKILKELDHLKPYASVELRHCVV